MAGNVQDPTIGRLIALAEATPDIAILWLYGSRARGTERPDSDYDLAAAFRTFIRDHPLETRLRPELLAIDWRMALGFPDDRLSVVDIDRVDIPLAYHVVMRGTVLYCRDRRRLLTEEKRIASRMELGGHAAEDLDG